MLSLARTKGELGLVGGSVMRVSGIEQVWDGNRVPNAVTLRNAVLCAECDVISDSPHDTCLVCGSRSLLNIARMFGGDLPKERATLVVPETEIATREVLLAFPVIHRSQRRATAHSR